MRGSASTRLSFANIFGFVDIDASKGTAVISDPYSLDLISKSTIVGIEKFVAGDYFSTRFNGSDHAETFVVGGGDDLIRGKGGSDELTQRR